MTDDEAGMGTGADSETGSGTETGAETGSDSETSTRVGTGAGARAGAKAETGAETRTETGPAPVGRRERKKAATRRAIADAALRLFLERGYDDVGIREIAEAADVSTTTLFKHFPVKEALVFDEDADHEARLLAAVRERPEGQSIPAALREHALRHRMAATGNDARFTAFFALVDGTPALRDYVQKMWLRHTAALARVIAEQSGLPADDPTCTALAHFALEAPHAARGHTDPRRTITRAFDLLESGWRAVAPGA